MGKFCGKTGDSIHKTWKFRYITPHSSQDLADANEKRANANGKTRDASVDLADANKEKANANGKTCDASVFSSDANKKRLNFKDGFSMKNEGCRNPNSCF